mgnify:CR=1 FL=1
MAVKSPLARKTLGLLGAFALRLWRATIDWKAVYADPTVDPVHPRFSRRSVFACWHENLLMAVAPRAHRNNLGLASAHGDGEIISRAIQHLGWSVVRGSTTRGGVSALLKLLRDDKRNFSFTSDGPRGPRRTMSVGPIFLASKLGIPLTCIGYGSDRPWRLRSWDRFAIPRPYSRARAVFGPPLRVPAKLDRNAQEGYRAWFERLLNWLTDEAEIWAESGRRRRGELPMLPSEAPPQMLKWNPAHALRLPDWLNESWISLGNSPIGVGSEGIRSAA